ncbi:TPA: hypothetical protein N0F65_009287 [Lagenidium giganteum]|uniref:Uncharacterized protein n=1 Tax=Lagenidium giganteum TaxID=4803 RepID=A0AAV2YP73_9STRA|nr:TPA: hypothetical protein N0F65_009287 [Lagenidium giganteum]
MKYNKSDYEPILPKKNKNPRTPNYACFEQQKLIWASIDRRSHRIRLIAYLQIVLSVSACFNYLWFTNCFGALVGFIGLTAVKSEKMSWTLVYLLMCGMEFVRNILLAPHIYERYVAPGIDFSRYEYFQVLVMVIQNACLIPTAFCVVFAATASLANPLW